MKTILGFALVICTSALAQPPGILLEACNQMEPANKRLECLRAATSVVPRSPAPQALAGATSARSFSPSTTRTTPHASSQTCFVGPRGGTYTITASGKKNYGGC